VTEPIIRAATAGMKEADSSTISVLNSMFAPMTRKRVKELGMGEEEESKYVGRLSREIESINNLSTVAAGQSSQMFQKKIPCSMLLPFEPNLGCFAHYPNLRQHDATFSRYEKANECLTTFDAFSATMYSDGDFGLHTYLSYLIVPFYPLFQERGNQRIERDQADWEVRHFPIL
jgi:chromosome transmission fidelity protein 18